MENAPVRSLLELRGKKFGQCNFITKNTLSTGWNADMLSNISVISESFHILCRNKFEHLHYADVSSSL